MFYDLDLDDRAYQDIAADAVFQIPGECPEWTNHNSSDPGITLVQLFSWLKEVQQYQLSRISSEKRMNHLRLLGMEPERLCQASGSVYVEPGLNQIGTEITLLKGTRFFAGDMAFETQERETVHPVRLIGAYMVQGETMSGYYNIGSDFERQIRLYPFGEMPETGNQCCFVLDGPLCQTGKTDIYFDIRTDYEVSRNPVEEGFIPLARLRWDCQTGDGWEEMEVLADDTHELIQSGNIRFRLPGKMAPDADFGAWQIRVTLLENDYDVAPLIQDVHVNGISVRQQYTLCDYEDYEVALPGQGEIALESGLYLAKAGQVELYLWRGEGWVLEEGAERRIGSEGAARICFNKPDWAQGMLRCRLLAWEEEWGSRRIPGRGDGFANQEYALNTPDIVYDDFEIMVQDGEGGAFLPCHKVEDFGNSSPEDRDYLLDLPGGRAVFGDCENGMAPEGEIRIIRLRRSLGKAGNIKANKIRTCEAFPELLVKQYRATAGGRDHETPEQCFRRARLELRAVRRGVTYADYGELVKKTPGLLILDSRVIPPTEWERRGERLPENRISIVVQPLSYHRRDDRLNEKYRQNLSRMLEQRKMLGTSIQILNPEYIGVFVYAEIVIKAQFQDAEEQIEGAVTSYLDEKSWEIGRPVLCGAIYGLIDTLPCVWQVRSLAIDGQGKGLLRLVNGDLDLPPNGLAYLKDLDVRISTAEQE